MSGPKLLFGSKLKAVLQRQEEFEQQLAFLTETSEVLASPVELHRTLDRIFQGLLHRYGLSACLSLVMGEEGALCVEQGAGFSQEFMERITLRSGEGAAGVAYASARWRYIPNAEAEPNDPLLKEAVQRQQVKAALFLPLEVDGRTEGVLALFAKSSDAFQQDRQAVLQRLAKSLSLLLHNARWVLQMTKTNQRLKSDVSVTLQELQQTNARLIQKVRELTRIYDLALATAAGDSVADITRIIIAGVKELIQAQGGAFFLWQPETHSLQPLSPAFDQPIDTEQALQFSLEDGRALKQVFESGQPQIFNFVDRALHVPVSWAHVPIRSMVVLPLREGDQVKGVFCVINKAQGLFTEDDVRLLSLLTSRVADVMQKLVLHAQLRQRVQDLTTLQEMTTHLPSPPALETTVHTLAQIARHSLHGIDFCVFFLHTPEMEQLSFVGGDWDPQLSFDPPSLTTGSSENMPLSNVFRESQMAKYPMEGSADDWTADVLVRAGVAKTFFYLPLTVEHRTIGVMAVGSRSLEQLDSEHERLARLFADHVAVIVERSRLYGQLRKANEKLEQINKLKNEFISMVSHELRTPLTTIKGFVSIVHSEEVGVLNDQQRRFLDTAERAIDRLTLLVSDLLDISRIEAGHIKMQAHPISLKEVFGRVQINFEPQLKAAKLSLAINVPAKLPMALVDPHRLMQVLENLISNAIKYTAKGGITLSAQDKGDFILVSVKDTGIGIAEDEKDKIFDKFYQVKTGGGWPAMGTGLGLAIVRSIVDSHRGKVWVESTLGKGAEFFFLVPRAKNQDTGTSPKEIA